MSGTFVLGATTTTVAAIVLPNTGTSKVMLTIATITFFAGALIVATTVARLIAKKAFKA